MVFLKDHKKNHFLKSRILLDKHPVSPGEYITHNFYLKYVEKINIETKCKPLCYFLLLN